MGMYALGVVVAPVIGPTLGGYLTDQVSWRWAFYINIPIGLVAALMQSRYLEDPPFIKKARPGPLDGTGLAFLALWLGALQVVCDKGQEDDWFGSSLVCWMTAACILGFIAWIIRERAANKDPHLDRWTAALTKLEASFSRAEGLYLEPRQTLLSAARELSQTARRAGTL